MKHVILLAALLASCHAPTWGGAADWITPDEFPMGQGSSSMSTLGGHINSENPAYSYDGEGESSYAALTWNLPTWEGRDGGMDRTTQRNMALLLDKMVADEIQEEGPDATAMTLREGAPTPPWWLPYGFGAAILLFLIFMGLKSRSNGWH